MLPSLSQTAEASCHDIVRADAALGCLPAGTHAAIWLLCHYPDTAEADERIETVVQLHRQWGLPIWLYGSSTARYPESVERIIRGKLLDRGVDSEVVICSGDLSSSTLSLDTVQEAQNVASAARQKGIQTLLCVSNRLQLLQVRALLRREPLSFVWIPTRLRDWRWWYVGGRLLLIPLAFLGIGPRFAPLIFVRWARARLETWPF
ncbi:MAG: hypothetical protein EPO61_00795 [Nitrospirae bacterium]|nr:MAG: hypothetical protein EPO61_00795 [Nitrospirota bacterium]